MVEKDAVKLDGGGVTVTESDVADDIVEEEVADESDALCGKKLVLAKETDSEIELVNDSSFVKVG